MCQILKSEECGTVDGSEMQHNWSPMVLTCPRTDQCKVSDGGDRRPGWFVVYSAGLCTAAVTGEAGMGGHRNRPRNH